MKFFELLIETREKRNLKKCEAAKILGWSSMYYCRYEKGQLLPTKRNIDKFCVFLNISKKELDKIITNSL